MSVAKRSVAMAFDLPGPAKISFFGGEPLLRLDLLKEIVQHAETESQRRGERVYFSITTNATLLTEEVRDYLYAHRFYLGLSIDGCRAAHDATRRTVNNKSSFDTIVENVRPILSPEPGTPRPPRGVKVLAVVDPMNVAHLGDSFEALLKMGAKNLSMNLNYEADWDQESLTTLSASPF